MDWYSLLDIGGTAIKHQAVSADGFPIGKMMRYPSLSGESCDAIVSNIAEIAIMDRKLGMPLAIAMAFPGPFDYERGISYMKGLGKYESIYGKMLRPLISEKLSYDIPMVFINDVEAFALGVARQCGERAIAIAIGTGCGSAFISGGKIVKSGFGVPENGWIYSTPFMDSTIDDHISARGLAMLSEKYFGRNIPGEELDGMAAAGDRQAQMLFDEFGSKLFSALLPFIEGFQPSSLVLGGMISRSFRHFGKEISEYAEKNGIGIITVSDTSAMIHKGLYRLIEGGPDA